MLRGQKLFTLKSKGVTYIEVYFKVLAVKVRRRYLRAEKLMDQNRVPPKYPYTQETFQCNGSINLIG